VDSLNPEETESMNTDGTEASSQAEAGDEQDRRRTWRRRPLCLCLCLQWRACIASALYWELKSNASDPFSSTCWNCKRSIDLLEARPVWFLETTWARRSREEDGRPQEAQGIGVAWPGRPAVWFSIGWRLLVDHSVRFRYCEHSPLSRWWWFEWVWSVECAHSTANKPNKQRRAEAPGVAAPSRRKKKKETRTCRIA